MPAPWMELFPALCALEAEARALLAERAVTMTLPGEGCVYGPRRTPDHFILLLEGRVRVQQVAESGREMILYRLEPGDSCPLTTACLLANEDYPAEAVAEGPCEAIAIPRTTFDELMAVSPGFRRFVFGDFSRRFTNLFRVIDDIAFGRTDVRLAERLLELADDDGMISATHRELAAEIGTAREVVTRMLAQFQRQGWIVAGRGQVQVVAPAALQAFIANA